MNNILFLYNTHAAAKSAFMAQTWTNPKAWFNHTQLTMGDAKNTVYFRYTGSNERPVNLAGMPWRDAVFRGKFSEEVKAYVRSLIRVPS